MHPSIRILCCVIFTILVSQANWLQLGLFSILLSALVIIIGMSSIVSSLAMLKRLRWLFLSILVFSLWFTPGTPLLDEYSQWSPSMEGLEFGLLRLLVLTEIVIAVNLMLLTTETSRLTSSLQWLLQPLSLAGLNTGRFALRTTLTLSLVKNPAVDMKGLVADTKEMPAFKRMINVVTEAYKRSVSDNNTGVDKVLVIEKSTTPGVFQWLWLVFLVLVYYSPKVLI